MKRKINVLQVSYDYPPNPFWGMGIGVRTLNKYLSDYCNVILATPYRSHEIQRQRNKDKIKVVSSVPVWDAKLLFNELFPNDSYKDFELLSSWNLIFAKRVIEYYLSTNYSPDVVHNHSWMTFRTAKMVSQFFKVPLVESIHFFEKQYFQTGNQTTLGDIKEILNIESEISSYASRLIFFSENSRNAFLGLYPLCLRVKTVVIPHSIDLIHSAEKTRNTKLTSGKLTVLYVGRLVQEKGVKYLINAFRAISSEIKNLRLLIIGKGPIRKELELEASGLDVSFLGQIPYDKVSEYYDTADIFCLPSLTESFGLVIAEAMSFGLPILTTSGPTVPDLIQNNIDGLTVPLRYSNNELILDEKELTKALLRLVSDRRLRLKLGRSAEKHTKDFYPENEAIKTHRLYMDLIQQKAESS